jgi:hypothetical protein
VQYNAAAEQVRLPAAQRIPPCNSAAADDDVALMRRRCDACSIFSSKLAEPPEGLQVMGVEDPDFTSLCRLAKESRGALPRQVSSRPGDTTASSVTVSTGNRCAQEMYAMLSFGASCACAR